MKTISLIILAIMIVAALTCTDDDELGSIAILIAALFLIPLMYIIMH